MMRSSVVSLKGMGAGASRAGETSLRAKVTERVAPGVVYTTFHHPMTMANVVTTDYSDWATNCPEYKVTAVQVSPSNGPTDWQERYAAHSSGAARYWKWGRRNDEPDTAAVPADAAHAVA